MRVNIRDLRNKLESIASAAFRHHRNHLWLIQINDFSAVANASQCSAGPRRRMNGINKYKQTVHNTATQKNCLFCKFLNWAEEKSILFKDSLDVFIRFVFGFSHIIDVNYELGIEITTECHNNNNNVT